jgi:hypothetical protein
MNQRTDDDWNALQDVLAAHAVALVIATQYLEAASGKATDSDWLALIMAKAKTEYEACSADRQRTYLTKTLTAMGRQDINL